MQLPKRKPPKFSELPEDNLMTESKFNEISNKLNHLKTLQFPAAAEVSRLAELGDFSENVEYQLAKGRLRGINHKILLLEHQLQHASIIPIQKQQNTVHIGATVTVECEGKQSTYQILGSSESNPGKGIISHQSPLGSLLLGQKVGEHVSLIRAGKHVEYTIVQIA